MRIILCFGTTLLLLLSLACVSDPAYQFGDEGDQFIGQTGNNQGTGNFPGNGNNTGMANNPGTGNTPGGMGQTCIPGQRLGTCSICNANGQPSVPPSDESCPVYDCGGGYELITEGNDDVCYATSAGMTGCIAMGQCQTQQEYCANAQRMAIERIPQDPCRRINGCSGNIAPSIEQSVSLGDACNGSGVCQARNDRLIAECSIQIPGYCNFGQATNARFFCEQGAGQSAGQNYCTYFVAPPDGSSTRCVDFCSSLGLEICDQTVQECCWNNATESTCETSGGVNCEVNPCDSADGCRDQICRCFVPLP